MTTEINIKLVIVLIINNLLSQATRRYGFWHYCILCPFVLTVPKLYYKKRYYSKGL